MPAASPAKPAFDLKSTAWTLTALRLQTGDAALLAAALEARFADSPGLFDGDPVAIDLSLLREADVPVDVAGMLPHLRRLGMLPIAVQGGSPAQMTAARAAGLAEAPDAAANGSRHEPSTVHEAVRDSAVAPEAVKAVPATPASQTAAVPPMVLDKPLRSGQRIYARGGDLIVLAVVSFGAEVIADGNIHVYAPLRGRAIAGARGDVNARIFSTCLEPQLVSIAGIYRTTETPLPANVLGRAAQVRLDGEKIIVEPLGA